MIDCPVLVLNQNYQPLNVCNARRALVLLGLGKAEMMANSRGEIHTASRSFIVLSVIRLFHMVSRLLMQRRLSRRSVFHHDGYKCQYCGLETRSLTLDHIIPRSRGGPHSWENVVSACIPCNHRKAGMLPSAAKMQLARQPRAPRPDPYALFHYRTILEDWRQFIPWVR